ncbi:hypothetical protein FA95DRAFT_1578274 [Auriscalpium vulgare]|uniref:Uncharacterized protein n=1 Tax=Auriscalpium vulgare TaxID=40419 RepID=A0ACB8R2U5_9AGAM|nr:hypothetical protein FA95DRAFT_1578274 [Auriscalpium vulgare]
MPPSFNLSDDLYEPFGSNACRSPLQTDSLEDLALPSAPPSRSQSKQGLDQWTDYGSRDISRMGSEIPDAWPQSASSSRYQTPGPAAHLGLNERRLTDSQTFRQPSARALRVDDNAYTQLNNAYTQLKEDHFKLQGKYEALRQVSRLLLRPLPPFLSRTSYPNVTIWSEKDYKMSKNSDLITMEKKKHAYPYIQRLDGNLLDDYEIRNIRDHARELWHELLRRDLAPPTWGKVSVDALAIFRNGMYEHAPYLLCSDSHWKLKRFATDGYPYFYRNNVLDRVSGTASVEKCQPSGIEKCQPSGAEKRKRSSKDVEKGQKPPKKRRPGTATAPPSQTRTASTSAAVTSGTPATSNQPVDAAEGGPQDDARLETSDMMTTLLKATQDPTDNIALSGVDLSEHMDDFQDRDRPSTSTASHSAAATDTSDKTTPLHATQDPADNSALSGADLSEHRDDSPDTPSTSTAAISAATPITRETGFQTAHTHPTVAAAGEEPNADTLDVQAGSRKENTEAGAAAGHAQKTTPRRTHRISNPLANIFDSRPKTSVPTQGQQGSVSQPPLDTPPSASTSAKTSGPAAPLPASSEAQAATGKSNGGKILRPSTTSTTPRNLYAIDYKKNHRKATVDEFDVAFAALSTSERQIPDSQLFLMGCVIWQIAADWRIWEHIQAR